MECIFCKIIVGEVSNYTVYKDENTLAFLDINPHAKGHAVVIHKDHGALVNDLSEQAFCELASATKKTVRKIDEVLSPDGYNIGLNNGEVAGQAVPHLHMHILPRYKDDGGGSIHSIINNPGEKSVEEIAKMF